VILLAISVRAAAVGKEGVVEGGREGGKEVEVEVDGWE